MACDLYGTPSLETDKFSQWRIEPVNGKKDVYAIASRNTEASASLYLYQNEALGRLSAVPQQPSAQFEAAQWKIVYTGENTPPLYGFDENSKTYENPRDGYYVVSITRTFQPGQWTTFCSPVDLTESQLKQLFGDDVQVAELKAQNTNELQFVTSHSLKAGVPCIIKVMKPTENNEYLLEDNFTFASQAETVPVNGGTFYGTLTVTKPDFGYALNPNTSAVEPIDNGYVVDAMSAYYVSYLDVASTAGALTEPPASAPSPQQLQKATSTPSADRRSAAARRQRSVSSTASTLLAERSMPSKLI